MNPVNNNPIYRDSYSTLDSFFPHSRENIYKIPNIG
jgi:hypothetical protein